VLGSEESTALGSEEGKAMETEGEALGSEEGTALGSGLFCRYGEEKQSGKAHFFCVAVYVILNKNSVRTSQETLRHRYKAQPVNAV
jgi:hypothetical protein